MNLNFQELLQSQFQFTYLVVIDTNLIINKFYRCKIWIDKNYLKMEKLLDSRFNKETPQTKFQTQSPEKFGKGAFANLSYTPSKLVDNVLYKEVVTMKKVEEESSKVRNFQALNGLLNDRVSQLTEEKEGIEQSLTQQITMYKKLLNETELKNQQRLKDLQENFSYEIKRIIQQKQEEAKYSQAQKQLLEGKIQELQDDLADHRQQLEHGGNNFDTLKKQYEKLQINHKHTCQKLKQTETRYRQDKQKAKNEYQELSRKLFNTQVEHKAHVQKLQLERQKQTQLQNRLHRGELQKVQNKRQQEAALKNQQLKDLVATFEAESNRHKQTIQNKERVIEKLNSAVSSQKQNLLNVTKNATEEITNLLHQKSRMKQEIDSLNLELANSKQNLTDFKVASDHELSLRDNNIRNIKEELQITQVAFIRDKDKTAYLADDLQKQIIILKAQNARLEVFGRDNAALSRQIRNLKDLLLESSLEMEKCKDEFLRIGREKQALAVQVRQLDYENQSLHRLRIEKEEQVRGWRDNYYLGRR